MSESDANILKLSERGEMTRRIRNNTIFWGAVLGSFCANKLGNEFVLLFGLVPKGEEVESSDAGITASMICYPAGFVVTFIFLWWFLAKRKG